MRFSLNNLYSQYIKGTLKRSDFEGLIYQYLGKNQDRLNFGHWIQEEYDDFVSWFYQRIHSSINSYCDTGSSFEVFMLKVIRLAAKEYRTMVTSKSVTEYAAWTAHLPEQYAREEAPVYLADTDGRTQATESKTMTLSEKDKKNPRQILILILKCYSYVSDDFLDKIAPKIGIGKEKLREMIDRLRSMRAQRDNEVYQMRERIYSQFYRCIVYEKRLSYLPADSSAAIKMKSRLVKARQRLEKMRKRILSVRTDATNKQVAEVIGISKGAVDSSLYALKARWKDLMDKSMLN